MKVYIGPYVNWFGPYQMADLLQKVGVSDDRCHEIGRWLSNTCVGTFLEWIHTFKKRSQFIKIDNYDTWNAFETMSIIILPMLKKLHAEKHGSPRVEDEDVPWCLRSHFFDMENEWDSDPNFHKRWEWVMDEMIWTFEQLQPDYDWDSRYHHGHIDIAWIDSDKAGYKTMTRGPKDTHWFDKEGYENHYQKIQNGLRLFGKYYQALWD